MEALDIFTEDIEGIICRLRHLPICFMAVTEEDTAVVALDA